MVEKCRGWRPPTKGTPDYLNVCASDFKVGVPRNFAGYQECKENTYMGLYNYYSIYPSGREYISTDFPPLVVGTTYTMTITVSLADNSIYATDGLGVLFTTYPYSDSSIYTVIHVQPQIDYSSYGVIKNKKDWVTLSATFTADSAYTNLTVGCFKDTGDLKIEYVGDGDTMETFSYYYIARIGDNDTTRHSATDYFTPPMPDPGTIRAENISFPNAFTPNNDGRNDLFRLILNPSDVYTGYRMYVYNRWGQCVFYSDNPAEGWDGTYLGVLAEIGTYFYYADFNINGIHRSLKGDVTLIR